MDDKMKALVEDLEMRKEGDRHVGVECGAPDQTCIDAAATIRAQAEKIERIQQKGAVAVEMYEAELARIKSAEGCDIEGARSAYEAACDGKLWPYAARMSAALAVGCAPLRAKLALYATALRTIIELPMPEQDNMVASNMRRVALSALKEPANGNS